MEDDRFERILKKTLDSLPGDIHQALDTVQVVVQDWPSPEQLANAGLPPDDALYGLFEGVALPDKAYPDTQMFPDRVVVFHGPLQVDFPDPQELAEEIRLTLLHELGHYFGFNEEELDKRGYR